MKLSVVAVVLGLTIVLVSAGRHPYANKHSAEAKRAKPEQQKQYQGHYKLDKRSERVRREYSPENPQTPEEELYGEAKGYEQPSYPTSNGKQTRARKESTPKMARESAKDLYGAESNHEELPYGNYNPKRNKGKKIFMPEPVKESEQQFLGERSANEEGAYVSYNRKQTKQDRYAKEEAFNKGKEGKPLYSEAPEAPVFKKAEAEPKVKRSPGTFTRGPVLSDPVLIVDTISDTPLPPVSPTHSGTRISIDASQLADPNQPKFVPTSRFEQKLDLILEELRLWRLAQAEASARREAHTEMPGGAMEEVAQGPVSSRLTGGEEIFRVANVDTIDEIQNLLQLYKEFTRGSS